ncbi:OmpA family protein [Stenotrophomonas sp. HITSZ_GD]|uniref:OmpA family protein n=1 Tax=Stenotrophomonas sp. HITSZ_GD TaxID=3037248 RepID=UPI00240D8650|nr:OmpA family protein [Stenotrophomonas sp. HITSZ_GD]MDG2524960.1 OmpA family protein [Stenotrophomonas sp. HITSZ_GD]
MFDQLIQEVSGRFGLDTRQTRQLLGSAVALVFDDTRGGFAGFTERLHGLGLGEALQSWRAPGPSEPDPVRPGQVEALFGMPVLGALSRRLGLSPAVAAAALGTLLPGVVRQLGGQTSLAPLPAPVAGWVAQGRDLLADATPGLAPPRRRSGLGGLLRAVLWLAALAIAVLLLLRACQPTPADPAPAPEARAEADAAPQAPRAEPRIDLQTQGGQVSVAGRLVNAQEKHRLLEALGDTFGAARVKEQIQLDATVAPATWMDRLVQLLPHLKAGDVKLGLEGDSLRLDSSALPEAGRFDLSQQVSQAFPDFRSEGLWDRAMAALSALKPGFGADDLVLALNQSSLRFASGSAELTRDNAEVLARSAAALRAAPAGTRVEVGGHSDDSGDPATNMALSQARAESVVAALLADGVPPDRLQAKGYGAAQPVADNGTEEGRARNRRMTFTVLK